MNTYSIHIKPLTKTTNLHTTNIFHKKLYKKKYDDYMNKLDLKYIKLNYGSDYNWHNELIRINKFTAWHEFMDIRYVFGLFGVRIGEIPKEICRLTDLRVIMVSYCGIKKIPKEIYQLTNLRKFDFSFNNIQKISNKINKLVSLCQLYLLRNSIKKIPRGIFQLINLSDIILIGNHIKRVSKEIKRLINLEYIYVDEILIKQILIKRIPAYTSNKLTY